MKFRSILFFLLFSTYALCKELVGVYAVHLPTGRVIIDENSDQSLMPASCMKIITTAAALHLLGPDYRFPTDLEYDGILEDGVLRGNLYIHGGGDPCLGSERIPSSLSWRDQIECWAKEVQRLGVRKIEGRVIGDASRWEKGLAVPSWSWEDLGNYYGAGACALSFHENSYTLFFEPGKNVGENVRILRIEPQIDVTFHNEVTTGGIGSGDLACIFGSEFSLHQFIRGTIPSGVSEFAIKGAIPDPAAACAQLLTRALQRKGIPVESCDKPGSQKRITIHTTYSPPLKEIVFWMNKKSINLYAEHLVKKIGEVVSGNGSTYAGTQAIMNFLKSQKIDLDGFNMVDGSGLSRKNLVTPKQFVSILTKMKHSEFFPIFLQSLPEDKDKTRGKSGSMSLIKGSVGYSGHVVFAILINQCTDPSIMKNKIQSYLSKINASDLPSRVLSY